MERFVPHSLRSPYAPIPRPPSKERPLHIVLATTGSVASVKTPLIVERLLSMDNVRVQVISTQSSLHFFDLEAIRTSDSVAQPGTPVVADDGYTVQSLAEENAAASQAGQTHATVDRGARLKFWQTKDEWDSWEKIGDPILHIELRRWADVVLVAPCSANTLAKIHAGLCDDLLVSA